MDASAQRLEAELSKINFLLENLYALVLRELGASHEDIPRLSEEICRQAALPPKVYGPEAGDQELEALQELVEHRIAVFFSGVQDRLRNDRDR